MLHHTNGQFEPSSPKFIDLFCGAGLLSYGFKLAGLIPTLAIDIDPKAVRSYNSNVSNCAVVSDIGKIPPQITADVIIAGPPCQGFSTLGRADPSDQRNKLGLAVVDWAEIVAPALVVVENVPNFIGSIWSNELNSRLMSLDYDIQIFILDAADYGSPQRRKRAFTIASKIGPIAKPAPRKSKPRTFQQGVLRRPIRSGDPMHVWPEPSTLAAKRFALIGTESGKRTIMKTRPDLCPVSWFKIKSQATDVWSRIDPEQPTNTIRCSFQNPSKGRYIHPFEDRVISLREAARVQGIPDSWIMHGEPTSISRQIGNGVPIKLGRAIAKSVERAFSAHRIEDNYDDDADVFISAPSPSSASNASIT